MIRHYYHVYADGTWQDPVAEHLSALAGSALWPHITVGIVGGKTNRARVREALSVVPVDAWVEADTGWEQVTLAALRRDLTRGIGGPVLYAHTKGASDSSLINVTWRRSMTRRVVGGWRNCLDHLADVDAVGCHWLTPAEYPTLVESPFFGGNFWWANTDYLRTLPPLRRDTRWDAESWIGLGDPTVHDLLPGWPSMALCGERAPAGV